MNKILRLPEVKSRTGLSRSSIYAFIKKNQFPKPINIGIRSVGWVESIVDQWIESKMENSNNGGKNDYSK